MKIQNWKKCWAAPVIAVAACASVASVDAAFTMTDVEYWVDHSSVAAAGSVSEAVVVMDWSSGNDPLAWGFRWDSSQTITGEVMLSTLIGVESRLSANLTSSIYGAFFNTASYSGDGFGNPAQSATSNDDTGIYWAYSTYDTSSGQPEPWAAGSDPTVSLELSGVGMTTRTLADGSYDVWKYSPTDENYDYTDPFPLVDPIATKVPEPTVSLMAVFGLAALGVRRRRA